MPNSRVGKIWYYDACALDATKNTYREVFRGNKNGIKALASNLSIGEAYGNSYRKRGREAADAFADLIRALSKLGAFTIVNHNGIDKLFLYIRSETRLTIPDAIHLATAIKNGCCNLRTGDSDLYNLTQKKLKDIASKFNTTYCSVTKMR